MAYLYKRNWDRREILRHVGHLDQVAGIKLVEAADGRERGNRILQVWTGSGLYFHVLADRALDISACRYKGYAIGWHSSVGEVHPAYYEPEGVGFLRSFQGGLLVTCGLDQFGAPCSDAGEELGLHGRISNLPAQCVGYRTFWVETADEMSRYELEITGEVRQTRLFGEHLVLRRRISTQLGSSSIRIQDVVTNEGFAAHPHMMLYHFNLGFPLVSKDSQLRIDTAETIARDKDAAAGLAEWSSFQPPTPEYREQVFRHKPVANSAGTVQAEVKNLRLGLGVRLCYANTNLPYLFQWKMMGEGAYVLGIEPANCGVIDGRAAARERNDLPQLAAGESRHYDLEIEIAECGQ
jgi:hypothetical protein